MSKKKNVTKPVNKSEVEPKVEAQEQAEPTFAIKLEIMGAEPITLNGVNATLMNNIRTWFSGLGSAATEITVGDNLLILDRSKIAYLVVGNDMANEKGTAE